MYSYRTRIRMRKGTHAAILHEGTKVGVGS